MKEEKTIRKRKNPKGTVLFTVVAVMMVMIVFVMATLTIAGVANQRAYDSYSKNQTTYTARSAIEGVYSAMTDTTNPDLSNAVKSLSNGSSLPIGVTIPDNGMGRIKDDTITVECLPASQSYTQTILDSLTGSISTVTRDIVKITATAQLGNEESTVSAYYVKDPMTPKSSIFRNALTTMGSAMTGTSGKAYGGANIGITSTKWADKSTGTYESMSLSNNGVMTADFMKNGSVSSSGGGEFQFTKTGQGMVILGDFHQMKDNGHFTSKVNISSNVNYNDLPYVYVEREFQLYQDEWYNGNQYNIGSADSPINIYCGGYMNVTGNAKLYSDVYIYDHDFTKDISDDDVTVQEQQDNRLHSYSNLWTGGAAVGGLLEWVDTLVNKNNDNPVVGSNIFSKGSVNIGEPSQATYKLEGDVIVEENLGLNGGISIAGSVVSKGVVTINSDNGRPITISGGIFCDPSKLMVPNPGLTINGIAYNTCTDNYDFIQKVNQNATSNNGANVTIASSGSVAVLDVSNAVNYGNSMVAMLNNDTAGLGTNSGGETVYFFPASKELREILGHGDPDNKIVNTVADTKNQYVASNGYYKMGYLDKNELSATEYADIIGNADTKNTILDKDSCDNTIITVGNGSVQSVEVHEYVDDGYGGLIPNTKYLTSDEISAKYYKNVTINGVSTNVIYIDEDCTLQGTIQFSNNIVYVDPSTKADVWVKLGTLNVTNGATGIIVNDSNPNSNANFYIKADNKVSLDTAYIMTQSYYEKFINHTALNITENPSDKGYIPNIYIYSGMGTSSPELDYSTWPPKTVNKPNTQLNIGNNSMVTAYVVAPYLYLSETNAVSVSSFGSVSYEGEVLNGGDQLTIIGSAIVGEAGINNDAVVMYIDPTGGGIGGSGSPTGDWALLYYQNG